MQDCSKNATTGRFDSVQGQCFGALQPRWGWILAACDSAGEGGPNPLGSACLLNPFTKLDVRYAAAYQLSLKGGPGGKPAWLLQSGSSINTDGSQGHLANLTTIQNPSMGAQWGVGYYNRDTMAVGPPGMLFVLSVDKAYNFAWYLVNQVSTIVVIGISAGNEGNKGWGRGVIARHARTTCCSGRRAFGLFSLLLQLGAWTLLPVGKLRSMQMNMKRLSPLSVPMNSRRRFALCCAASSSQLTLDRCPDCSKPNCKIPATNGLPAFNCWGDAPGAEAGEIDLLETPFWSCSGFPELCNSRGYGRMYMTSGNSKGFCNPKLHSAYCNYTACGMGGHGTTNFFDVGDTATNNGGPYLYAAVVDAVGVTLYRDPNWAGLDPGSAAAMLTSLRPDVAPESVSPPCSPSPSSCARFSPLCVTRPNNATTYAIVPREQSRLVPCPGQGSFGMSSACVAASWWNAFADTGQWPVEPSSAEPQQN